MFSNVDQGNEQDETREMWESCRPRKQNNKLNSFIELTGTTKKPQNHTLFIVKRKMSSQKNMVQSWFWCCFRFTTQAQLPVQYMDSNGKHLCQSSGRKHMGIATHTRAHTHRHLLYNLCFAIPKKIMTAGIRFPQNNPGTKKWIVSLIFSKTSTSPQQLNDRHMSSFPFSHSALPAHRLNTVSTLTTLTCGGWVSGEFGHQTHQQTTRLIKSLHLLEEKQNKTIQSEKWGGVFMAAPKCQQPIFQNWTAALLRMLSRHEGWSLASFSVEG